MQQFSNRLLWSFLLLICVFSLKAQENIWRNVSLDPLTTGEARRIIPNKFQAFQLDTAVLKHQLRGAPHENEVNTPLNGLEINLPTPSGSWQSFSIVAYDLLHPQLQEDWWYIKTWRGVSTTDPATMIRLDWTARGLHAMVLERGNTWFIDPYYWDQWDYYQVYYKKDYPEPRDNFECLTEDDNKEGFQEGNVNRIGDCQLRQYDLALACTGEYATFHGGTTAGAASAMATTMNRVNGVYEADLALRFVLVANNNNLIFLNAGTDPYTNNSGSTMLGENQTTCDNVIGNGNYDMGHVFSTGGGGVATLRSPCVSSLKARGVTGRGAPVGDPFDIDYVAHEMGHQFGGNHTQNNNCNRSNASMEPGSASTIMGYAGICSPNVQSNSDDYYHGENIREIANYMELGGGNTCATIIDMSNNNPTINAGQDYDIPGGTPFVLTGDATDPDGDPITYCWEQFDNEVGEDMPPLATNTQGPVFRSFDPTSAAERYFPRLTDLVNNVDPTWETLPETNRDMDFRVTVRDFDGTYGCTTEDDITLTVDAGAGPFLVTNPNTNVTWNEGSQATVNWDIAGTTAAPISCNNVDILLSYDGGFTYPTTLLSTTPNDGSQTINVPAGTSTTARIMVRCSDNVFFDISNTNFTIDAAAVPDYTFNYSGTTPTDCEGSSAMFDYLVNSASIGGYADPLTLSAISSPVGVNVSFSANPINPGDDVTVTVSNFGALSAGNYTVTVQSASTAGNKTVDLPFALSPLAAAPGLVDPADGATDTELFPSFNWNAAANADTYLLEVAEDPGFGTIVYSNNTSNTSLTLPTALSGETVYYWRVTSGSAACGTGNTSVDRSFETEPCYYYENDTAVAISDGLPANYSSVLNVPHGGEITDIDLLNLDISHSWVGDLRVQLVAPNTTTRTMFSYICSSADDVLLSFDDEAGSAVSCPLNTGDKVQPLESLSNFDALSMTGDWTLSLRDNANQDGGSLNSWALKICTNNFSLLPVEWLSFEAKARQNSIGLSWETSEETDNAGFDIERRASHETEFRSIGWMDAVGSARPISSYSYEDKGAMPGTTYYYRLRQVDYSGREEYSEIRSAILASSTPQWTFYPNPSNDKLNLRFWNTEELIKVQLVDLQGQVIQSMEVAPEQLYTIDMNRFPSGIYWLKVATQAWGSIERIVKLR